MIDPVDLSILIVTYKSKEHISLCLQSIVDATEGISSEIIIVDNGSGDGLCDLVRTRFPGIQVIENERNEGFARGVNIGSRVARGRYLSILNPDTRVFPDTFKVFLDFLENHPGNCIAGARTVSCHGKSIASCRSLPHIGNILRYAFSFVLRGKVLKKPRRHLLDIWDPCETVDVSRYDGYLTGACLVLPLSLFIGLGMFDERFFLYGEDADFGFRILQAGYPAFVVSGATLVHLGGQSAAQNPRSRLYFTEGYLYYIQKNFKVIHGTAFKICFFALALGWFLKALLTRQQGEIAVCLEILKRFIPSPFRRSSSLLKNHF